MLQVGQGLVHRTGDQRRSSSEDQDGCRQGDDPPLEPGQLGGELGALRRFLDPAHAPRRFTTRRPAAPTSTSSPPTAGLIVSSGPVLGIVPVLPVTVVTFSTSGQRQWLGQLECVSLPTKVSHWLVRVSDAAPGEQLQCDSAHGAF